MGCSWVSLVFSTFSCSPRRSVVGRIIVFLLVLALLPALLLAAPFAARAAPALQHVVVIGVGGLFLFCMGVLFFFFLSTLVRWSGLAEDPAQRAARRRRK